MQKYIYIYQLQIQQNLQFESLKICPDCY